MLGCSYQHPSLCHGCDWRPSRPPSPPCCVQGYDGLVLEAWNQWAAWGALEQPDFAEAALGFIAKLGASLHDAGKQLLLAVPPILPAAPGRPAAKAEQLAGLLRRGDVDGLSIMLYDAAVSGPSPNAPLPWQEKNLRMLLEEGTADEDAPPAWSGAVLMGVPFYAYDFTEHVQTGTQDVAALTCESVLALLGRHQPPLEWHAEAAEHSATFRAGTTRHTIFFPTPSSFAARLELALRLGVGVSIWELGQGMDAFFDLL